MKLPTADNLATIRVVYQTPFRGLVGIPYEMRPGQSPKHLEDFSRNPPRSAKQPDGSYPDWTEEWITLNERWNAPEAERALVRAFIAQLRERDELPMRIYEFCTLEIKP